MDGGGDAADAAGLPGRRLKVLLVVNVDWFFWSHRLPIARGLRDAGHEVVVATGSEGGDFGARIEAAGFRFHSLRLRRGARGPLAELAAIRELAALYRDERPDVVHHVTIKPILYGSLAARLVGLGNVVNAISGLGWASSGETRTGRVRRALALLAYRVALASRHAWTIFQNREDRELFTAQRIAAPERSVLIRGSGVDTERFAPSPEPAGIPTVLFASRLLWDKGVAELIAAVPALRRAGRELRVVLAGRIDGENPRGIPERRIRAWAAQGLCEWRGLVDEAEMPALLREANVVVLPSYREGVPKILLEAAASSRALVATDVPGCREIARHGVNALLVPPRDAAALAGALETLLADPAKRTRFGRRGREIAEAEFAEPLVVDATLALYRRLAEAPS